MNNKTTLQKCSHCGSDFFAARPSAKFCSDICRVYQHRDSNYTRTFKYRCFECAQEFKSAEPATRFCSGRCMWANHQRKQTRDNIHKKVDDEILLLIAKRENQDPDFIRRLHASCIIAGFDFDRALQRYCRNDKTISIPQELIDAHKRVMDAEFRQGRKTL